MRRKNKGSRGIWIAGLLSAILILSVVVCTGCSDGGGVGSIEGPGGRGGAWSSGTFEKFKDKAEFKSYLDTVSEEKKKGSGGSAEFAPADAPAASPTATCEGYCGSGGGNNVETNNQSENVDEGDIIKFAGDKLVILRDQHLLVLDISGDHKDKPVLLSDKELDVDFGLTPWGKGAWYDEMLVHGSKIVLIAFRYAVEIETGDGQKTESSNAIELLSFNLSASGNVTSDKRVFIESNDYYSGATNYATRKIGGRLIVYSPFYAIKYVSDGEEQVMGDRLPYVLDLLDAKKHIFRRTAPAIEYNEIYKGSRSCAGYLLHTIYTFDLERGLDSFAASGVMGDYSGTYYVTDKSFYLNIRNWWFDGGDSDSKRDLSQLYRFGVSVSPQLEGIADISGRVTERFAMSELGDTLNVITFESSYDQNSELLHALKINISDFKVAAETSLPVDAFPSATRFNGNFAIVSFYQSSASEPLHLANFQGDKPSITASSVEKENVMLMQLYGENRWITLGNKYEYRDGTYTSDIEVGIVKLSPAGELVGAASSSIKGGYAWSDAFRNDHAFFSDPEHNLIGFPYSMWTRGADYWSSWQEGVVYFSVAGDAINSMGDGIVGTGENCQECWYGNSRVVRSNDSFYNLIGRVLKVSKMGASNIMTEVFSLELFPRYIAYGPAPY